MLFAFMYAAPAHSELAALQAHSRACVTRDLAVLHVKDWSTFGKLYALGQAGGCDYLLDIARWRYPLHTCCKLATLQCLRA